jgi:hypothetical protein
MAKKRLKKFDNGGYTGQPDEPLESVYPLEEMFLAGPVGKALGKGVGAIANKVNMLRRPKITNRLYNEKIGGGEYAPGDTTKAYGGRNVFNPKEIDDIKESGYMRPRQTPGPRGKAPKQDKYFTMTDEPNQTLRVASDKIPKGRAVRREDIEMFDKESGTYKPLKKGGKVTLSKASSRGDGCAQRGKTRGKMC